MRMIRDGMPVKHVHQCAEDRKGQPMTAMELHEFAVCCLADEYRMTGATCVVRDKKNPNEADITFISVDMQVNVLVICRDEGSRSLEGVDPRWMVDEFRHTGNVPRATFAYIDTKGDDSPYCGGEYSFSFHSVSLLPDEFNEPLPEQLTPLQLAEKYAETWKRLDASIVRPYLDKDFHYKSDWVFDEMPSRYEYMNYFRPKLFTIKRSGSIVDVKVGVNRITGKTGLIMRQGNNDMIILLTTANGRITSARMAEFIPEFESAEKKLLYVIPQSEGWQMAYEEKLSTGLRASGWYIQEFFRSQGIEFPDFRWIQSELNHPAFQHLAFAYKGNIYSILMEFVNSSGNHILPQDIKNQIRECKNNDMIACTIPLDYETYEPLLDGNHLISTETRENISFGERKGNVVMSAWEINNFGVSIVKDQLRKEGKKIISSCDLLTVEPQIWFENEYGKKCYVIVNIISGNTPEAVNYKLNHELLLELLDYDGYYAELGIFPSDGIAYDSEGEIVPLSKRDSMTDPKEILYRDKGFYINYTGLRNIERKAAENGVDHKSLYGF